MHVESSRETSVNSCWNPSNELIRSNSILLCCSATQFVYFSARLERLLPLGRVVAQNTRRFDGRSGRFSPRSRTQGRLLGCSHETAGNNRRVHEQRPSRHRTGAELLRRSLRRANRRAEAGGNDATVARLLDEFDLRAVLGEFISSILAVALSLVNVINLIDSI